VVINVVLSLLKLPQPFFGVAIASTNYICFDGYLTKHERLQFAIPLRMIVSIQLAYAPPPVNPSLAPVIQPVPSAQVKADAIQIFTNDNKVHYFYSFSKRKSFEDFYNIIDHAWRANMAGQVLSLSLSFSLSLSGFFFFLC
jgi:hypothetical protein